MVKTTEKTEKKPAIKKDTEKKPRAARKKADEVEAVAEAPKKAAKAGGKYIFATGRRKTAVATVRLFTDDTADTVNKKPFSKYFFHTLLQNLVKQPLELTGLSKTYAFVATINGGGINAQAEALAHAIAKALATTGDDVKKVLKKNGLLTRDDRKKERKKPGLKRARRAPQWAKR